jgi:hypothetical protein
MAHTQSPPNIATSAEQPIWSDSLPQKRRVPAWVMSMLLHLVVLLLLALAARHIPQGDGLEPGRSGGIVLARSSEGKQDYFDGSQSDATSQTTDSSQDTSAATALPTLSDLAVDVGGDLPSDSQPVRPGGATGFLPGANDFTNGSPPRGRHGTDIITEVFGLEGKGSKFMYVFDHSASMSDFNNRPLRAAKGQLKLSMSHLDRVSQFQVIFYNHEPSMITTAGKEPRLLYGNEQDKARATSFIDGIKASGATRHMKPLLMALRLDPDVLYFLTDAEDPVLSQSDLQTIRRANRGTQIHAIEFGFGASNGRYNFLKKLADQNGGKHKYIDISQLPN